MAMVSFSFIVNSNAALKNMRRENSSKFRNGLGPSLLNSMVGSGLFEKVDTARSELLSYAKGASTSQATTVLNVQRPGSGDLLEDFIMKAVAGNAANLSYGFIRTGPTGFDVVAVPLVEETLKSIGEAILHYEW